VQKLLRHEPLGHTSQAPQFVK